VGGLVMERFLLNVIVSLIQTWKQKEKGIIWFFSQSKEKRQKKAKRTEAMKNVQMKRRQQ